MRRIEELCRRELSQQQRQRPQEQQPTAVPGQLLEEQVQACIQEGIQIARNGGRTLTQELRRQLEERCRQDGTLPEVQPTRLAPVAVSDEQLRECIRRVLGFLPAGRQAVGDEQRVRIEQACPEVRGRLGEILRSGNGDSIQPGGVATVLDPATTDCIQRILRRVPIESEELTEDEKRRILETCFGGVTTAPLQTPVPGQQQPPAGQNNTQAGNTTEEALRQLLEQQLALMRQQQRLEQERLRQEQERSAAAISNRTILECIRGVLGRLPSSPDGLTEVQRREVSRVCPETQGRLSELLTSAAAQEGTGPAISDRETLDCIRRTLGGLPSSSDVLTDSQRVEVNRACDAGGRLGQLLTPIAVEQSNQECIRRTLGRLPASTQDMTKAERRLVEQDCFGGRSIQGRLAEEAGPRRGFFTNSQAGQIGSVEKLTNPTGLAVLGILLTLSASAISLFKGN
ncbi:MAG: hypothetical protein BZY88_18685 [SAR202 cluster bacterium Io17-Chloro-G9]|nr:MAG: hypothetical protein BZY88_18685 [SAR202 cluster bacterium Io17-Chloro-G9]